MSRWGKDYKLIIDEKGRAGSSALLVASVYFLVSCVFFKIFLFLFLFWKPEC
jgi:hypothetical protein